MALLVYERIAQCAERFCADDSHGYSQYAREGDGTKVSYKLTDGSMVYLDGGDIDCSELVKDCVNAALTGGTDGPIGYMWTGNEHEELTALGFRRIAFAAGAVKRGDVLLREGHTGIALGSGRQAEAAISEKGTIYGQKGDQTGSEVRVTSLSSNWTSIYRHPSAESTPFAPCKFRATFNRDVRVRTSPKLAKDNALDVRWHAGEGRVMDGWWVADGCCWATYIGPTTKRRLYAAIQQSGVEYAKVEVV